MAAEVRGEQLLAELEAPVRRCLELAWESWCAGSIGIGAVVVEEASGVVVIADYPPADVALARALLSDTPMLTMAADRAPLVDALQVVIDLGTGRR